MAFGGMDFRDSEENNQLARACMAKGAACCKKGMLFLQPSEYRRIVDHLAKNGSPKELAEWLARCQQKDGYYLYDQKDACQFLDERNLCRLHGAGIKPSECFWWPLHVFWDPGEGFSLKAGTYCCDGCRFLSAQSGHTAMVERQARDIGLDLLKRFRADYPGQAAYRHVKTIQAEPHIAVVGTNEFAKWANEFHELGTQHFSSDLLYPVEEIASFRSPSHFFAGFVRDGKLVSCSDATIISQAEFCEFREGRLIEDRLYGGDLWHSEAYLYINTLILEQEHHIPYIYRQLFAEMQGYCNSHEITLTHCFAMATNEKVHTLLARGNFEEVGKYNSKYPIMLLDRQRNSMIHSMLPTWDNRIHPDKQS